MLDRRRWLCGDPTTNKLGCFYCLIFADTASNWGDASKLWDKFDYFEDSLKKHEGTRTGKGAKATKNVHLEAELQYKLFLSQTDPTVPTNILHGCRKQVKSYRYRCSVR